ncbi:hypothetical protein [Agitococcus lubricus]|uniref:Uncharacterized protein n=1 Tax=Agitococcus lubricus TaxID=1077255 RepID=A0A2T5J1E6_9GAMM|nr:hypothetical protein [Agitococcus lubricus]PTQ90266.1 hypothetical protein C8N29_10319 [Agitococcus lubricus]
MSCLNKHTLANKIEWLKSKDAALDLLIELSDEVGFDLNFEQSFAQQQLEIERKIQQLAMLQEALNKIDNKFNRLG